MNWWQIGEGISPQWTQETLKTNVKTKDKNETLPFKVFSLTLFALQSILSVSGATWTLCGRQRLYRLAGRITVRLNCKQVLSRDWGSWSAAHPVQYRLIYPLQKNQKSECKLNDSCTLNTPTPPSKSTMTKSTESHQKGGCRWLDWSLLQHIVSREPKTTQKTLTYTHMQDHNKHAHTAPSITSLGFKEHLQGGETRSEAVAFCTRLCLCKRGSRVCLQATQGCH